MAVGPTLTQAQAVTAIAEAEAGILQCMETFACTTFTVIAPVAEEDLTITKDKIDISKTLMCAMTAKEKSIAEVLEGLASKILADRGLVPGGDCDDDFCDC